MEVYGVISKEVAPKRAKLKAAQDALAKKQAQLQVRGTHSDYCTSSLYETQACGLSSLASVSICLDGMTGRCCKLKDHKVCLRSC